MKETSVEEQENDRGEKKGANKSILEPTTTMGIQSLILRRNSGKCHEIHINKFSHSNCYGLNYVPQKNTLKF